MRQARVSLPYNEAINKEEMKYWLTIMKEHTVFIKAGLPMENADLRDEAKEFGKAFSSLQSRLEKLKNQKQCENFHEETCQVMEAFYQYKRNLLSLRITGKMQGSHFPFFLEHIAREANYFLQLLNSPNKANLLHCDSQTQEVVVWLRFMAEHTRLICQYIDPSERRMQRAAVEFIELFETLTLEGRDFAAMLYCHQGEIKAFVRFLQDVRSDIERLCDFNKMAKDLIEECKLLTIMTPQLADHLRREAKHCLVIITMLEKGLIKHCDPTFEDDVDEVAWKLPERIEEAASFIKPEQEDILYYSGNVYDPYEDLDGEEEPEETIKSDEMAEVDEPEAEDSAKSPKEMEANFRQSESSFEANKVEIASQAEPESAQTVLPKKQEQAKKREKVIEILPVSTPSEVFSGDVKEQILQKAAEDKALPIQKAAAAPATRIQGISKTTKPAGGKLPRTLGKRP